MPGGDDTLPLVGDLRGAIERDGRSLNELGRATGVDPGQLSRFLRGERTLTLPAAAKVCKALGLRLVQEPKGGKRAGQ